jgi:hypothetical protein
MPKFLVLLAEDDHFAKWEQVDDAQRQRVVADFQAFDAAVNERGSIVYGDALDHPGNARTVQPAGADGERAVTDGPYAETTEQVGGLYVIDVADLETAVEVAKRLPREYLVEVRPTLEVEF